MDHIALSLLSQILEKCQIHYINRYSNSIRIFIFKYLGSEIFDIRNSNISIWSNIRKHYLEPSEKEKYRKKTTTLLRAVYGRARRGLAQN